MDNHFINGFIKSANIFTNAKNTLKTGREWQEGVQKARAALKAKPKQNAYLDNLSQKKNPDTTPSPYRQGNVALHSKAVEEYKQLATQNRFKTHKTPRRPTF